MKTPAFPSLVLLLFALTFFATACGSKKRATAGIADEYGMLSVKPRKEDLKKEKFDLKSIGEMSDPLIPEW